MEKQGTIADLLREVALSPEFQQRTFAE